MLAPALPPSRPLRPLCEPSPPRPPRSKRPKRPQRRRRKPLLAGSGLVKLYRTAWRDKKRRKLYRAFTLAYRDATGRHLEKRASLAAAQARADELADAIINGRLALDQVTPADWATLQRCQDLVRPLGKPLELVVAESVEALQIIRANSCNSCLPSLKQLSEFWLRHHPAGHSPKPIPEILTEMLAARKADGLSQNTLDDYESRLGRFAQDFTGPLLSLTAQDLNTWLANLKVSRRTRNNYRGNLVDLYRFATERGYLPKDWRILDDVARAKNELVKIEIFTPDELLKILAARIHTEERAKRSRHKFKTLIPYLVIGAFAGCRHEEMSSPDHEVLSWQHLDFDNGDLWVPAGAAKTRQKRILPMAPNLAAWLKPCAKTNGPICELANTVNACAQAAADAGVRWKDNGLRKSFISYRLALTDNLGQVAREAGNSARIIQQHYEKAASKREAKRWFDLWPTQAEILQLPLAL